MGIKHVVPAGLPTGTVSGKVAGDDWRADHTFPPFTRPLILGTTVVLTPAAAFSASGTELYATSKVCRMKEDLRYASQVKLVALVIATGNVAGASYKLQYRAADASSWSGGTDVGCEVIVGSTGGGTGLLHDSGWVDVPAGAQIDPCYLTVVVGTALGTTAPTIGSLRLYVR